MKQFESMGTFILLASIALAIVGFRLATQAGQGVGVIQNDGYAGLGGALIFSAGVLFGIWLNLTPRTRKKK